MADSFRMLAAYGFHFEQPWWLLSALVVAPLLWRAWRRLATLGVVRRGAVLALRALVVLLLAVLLAHPAVTRIHDKVAVVAVIDRSDSVPSEYWAKEGRDPNFMTVNEYLAKALARKPAEDQLGVIDVGGRADIIRLPSTAADVPKRSIGLPTDQSRLAAGVQMALAVAPPNTSVRILLISDGNETAGDLKAVARIAAANKVPIDVLALRYNYRQEVVFRRLVAPGRARSGQTVPLRFVLTSTHAAEGRLLLSLNGKPVDLDPASDAVTLPVRLKPGTNVETASLPVGTRGVHEFEATFIPADANSDKLTENNRASAVTFVAGPGHVLLVTADAREALPLAEALRAAKIDVRPVAAGEFPEKITGLLDADAVILVNVPNHLLSLAQQEMICRYVTDLGGGLVTVGGPDSYGAGGWIGSPVASILPVDMDPPQKKQMPKGALVLVMHACEMPNGNYWGKRVAIAAVQTLSRQDLVGVLDFSWNAGMRNWVYPLAKAGNKRDVIAAINQMVMGDMPDFGPPVEAAWQALKNAPAGQKHIIIISDGDPQVPSKQILQGLVTERITCTGVAVFPHSPQHMDSLKYMAKFTGGRFYEVKDPQALPQIFIKEAQVVRRSLIQEDPFTPKVTAGLNEILRGLGPLPPLDGRVLTGPKGGLSEVVLASPDGDPVLATVQSGLGRVASFTSTADSRWAGKWLAWGGFGQYWEQTVRWAARSPQSTDCEAFADVQGRNVLLTVEAVRPGGEFVQLSHIAGTVIDPEMKDHPIELRQIGPGQYRAEFRADKGGGSYLVNLRYRKAGEDQAPQMFQTVVTVPYAPEFEDLKDNSALLGQVAEITHGRRLAPNPDTADLFSRAGLTAPRTPLPITRPLLLAWIVLFLLDVGVRRIAIDVAALFRKLVAKLRLGAEEAGSATLAALKARRQRVQERLARSGEDRATAKQRYAAGEDARAEMPKADLTKAPPAHREPAKGPPPEAKPPGQEPETHVSRLLKAKRRAQEEREQ